MKEFTEWCEFFQQIEKDPKAMVEGLKVKDLLEARQHVSDCEWCAASVERVLASAPAKTFRDDVSIN